MTRSPVLHQPFSQQAAARRQGLTLREEQDRRFGPFPLDEHGVGNVSHAYQEPECVYW